MKWQRFEGVRRYGGIASEIAKSGGPRQEGGGGALVFDRGLKRAILARLHNEKGLSFALWGPHSRWTRQRNLTLIREKERERI